MHLQIYELMTSLHSAFAWHGLEIHSSISEKFNLNFMNRTKYIRNFWIEIAFEKPTIYDLLIIKIDKLPMQEVPSPENPSLHSQVYKPI